MNYLLMGYFLKYHPKVCKHIHKINSNNLMWKLKNELVNFKKTINPDNKTNCRWQQSQLIDSKMQFSTA